jgi:hypothetical protein
MQLMMQFSCFITVSPLMPKSLQIALPRGSISAAAQRVTHRLFFKHQSEPQQFSYFKKKYTRKKQ